MVTKWLTVTVTLFFVCLHGNPDDEEEQQSCSINPDGTTNCAANETPFGMVKKNKCISKSYKKMQEIIRII